MIEGLEGYLKGLGGVAVAYSGGVDSTFLLAVAAKVLPHDCLLALTVVSPLSPPWEVSFAEAFCRSRGIEQVILDGSFLLQDEQIANNPPMRCYHCKRRILQAMRERIKDSRPLLTGTNASDDSQKRPGMLAEKEMGIETPLRYLGFTKEKIREYSQAQGIPGSLRPPSACLATRIPYGEPITMEKLRMVQEAEFFLRGLGFELVRVRLHSGDIACIELGAQEMARGFDMRREIERRLIEQGFRKVNIDQVGYS